jgi:hypothetical protein
MADTTVRRVVDAAERNLVQWRLFEHGSMHLVEKVPVLVV